MTKKFEFLGEALCLDFVNTLHDTAAKDQGEDLSSDADVAVWAAEAGILTAGEMVTFHAGVTKKYVSLNLLGKRHASLCDEARALREALRAIFQRAVRGKKIGLGDVETLNLLLKCFSVAGQIEKSNGDWTMNWDSRAGGAERVFYAIVKSAAEVVATGRWRALRECDSDTCTWMFLDTSKNHSRRWCEMARCGNRDKVQRFRARSRRADRNTRSS